MNHKIWSINTDKIYTNWILSQTEIFRFVHPNVLSILGILMDFVILYSALNYHFLLLGVSLFVRYSCDCLDGAVARKYNRVSNFGGFLDTLADNTMIFVLAYSITTLLENEYALLIACIITSFNLLYLAVHRSLIHHNGIKQGGNVIQNIYTLGVNNNCILYLIAFIFILSI